ncbi:fumarylacetoacetate hydrolase [Lentinula edodes]|uniref:Fumarylacetoacetate hydrolase n=1 Tax=Lentinula edodes TaxID=5353 RepID=A0A1Q3E0R9_LENED|nr:fumarylacetoacetate hydrolase [Lentinula edodes]
MAPIRTQWTRLIRFVAAETSRVHIGEPIDPNIDVGVAAHQGTPIKAYEIIGSALDPAAQVSQKILTVKYLLSPLTRNEVGFVRCLGLNYHDHAEEIKMAAPPFPVLFVKPTSTLIGPEGTVIIPAAAQPVKDHLPDYEVEFTIVIGKAATNVKEEDALDYVLAYTGANDVSFRTHQMAVSQWCFSKGFDNTNPLGPCLVSASAIPDPQKVSLKCKLNGETVQNGTTADQIFQVRRTIAHLSQGFARKPPIYLKHGDRIETWVGGGIGTLFNDVKEERGSAKL